MIRLNAISENNEPANTRSTANDSMSTGFSPYQVLNEGLNEDQIVKFCEDVNTSHRKLGLVSPFALYDDILSFLLRSPFFEIRPLEELSKPIVRKSRKNPNPISRVGLRHDMDGDIVTGLKCAKRLSNRRIPGTFFILHTSGYYGEFKFGVFRRYPGVERILDNFGKLRTEIGLHNDGLMFYHDHQVDGTDAVISELAWIRSCGIPVKGVVAHNSAPAYGGENFEMFEGLSIGNRRSIKRNDIEIPLQTISLSSEALRYEGNFSLQPLTENAPSLTEYISDLAGANIREPSWQTTHFLENPTFERDYEVSVWLLAADSWMLALHGSNDDLGSRRINWPLSTQSLKQHLTGLEPGLRIMLNIHPEYLAL